MSEEQAKDRYNECTLKHNEEKNPVEPILV